METYPPSPKLLEGILVPLVWVHLYVYLDNARYTEGILYSLQYWWRIDRPAPPVALQLVLTLQRQKGYVVLLLPAFPYEGVEFLQEIVP